MDILKKLTDTARAVAKDGMKRAGIRMPKHADIGFDADVDETDPKDLFERVQRELSERFDTPTEVPHEYVDELLGIAQKCCAGNDALYDQICAWTQNRALMEHAPFDPSHGGVLDALFGILHAGGVVCKAADGFEAIENVAKMQRRPIYNLLFQANRQCADCGNGTEWREAMNGRLAPFSIAIEDFDGKWRSIIDTNAENKCELTLPAFQSLRIESAHTD